MRTQTIKFNDFMNGEYKVKEKNKKRKNAKKVLNLVSTVTIPLMLTGSIGVGTLAFVGVKVAASTTSVAVPVAAAVPVGAKEFLSDTALMTLTHVLDPLVDIMVALSFPIASVIIVAACFFFMFNNSEKAWSMITNAGLGYVLIQVSPLILDVLKTVGNAAI